MKMKADTQADHVSVHGVKVPLVNGVCDVSADQAEILRSHGFEPVVEKAKRKPDAKETKDDGEQKPGAKE